MIKEVWTAWKQKSSEGLGLSLQLAAARELGGHHRMTADEQTVALQNAEQFGGLEHLQAYVRGQWEVTQMVMQKAGESQLDVYRGLMLPGEAVNATRKEYTGKLGEELNVQVLETGFDEVNRHYVSFMFNGQRISETREDLPWKSLEEIGKGPRDIESPEQAIQRRLEFERKHHPTMLFAKLPDLVLQRAGAQSTTGTASVANGWGGVGDLPQNPKRVVVRISAPPTSVLSLPVYGQNSQEEHESVLMGTKDRWLWDAWYEQAPSFESQTIATERKLRAGWSYPTGLRFDGESRPSGGGPTGRGPWQAPLDEQHQLGSRAINCREVR